MIQSITQHNGLAELRRDLTRTGDVLLWAYLLKPDFFLELFAAPLAKNHLWVLADDHQRRILEDLQRTHPKLHVATWSHNRTMHAKTILLPESGIAYFTSANLTRGSWTLSVNTTIRIESEHFVTQMARDFHSAFQTAKILPLRQTF